MLRSLAALVAVGAALLVVAPAAVATREGLLFLSAEPVGAGGFDARSSSVATVSFAARARGVPHLGWPSGPAGAFPYLNDSEVTASGSFTLGKRLNPAGGTSWVSYEVRGVTGSIRVTHKILATPSVGTEYTLTLTPVSGAYTVYSAGGASLSLQARVTATNLPGCEGETQVDIRTAIPGSSTSAIGFGRGSFNDPAAARQNAACSFGQDGSNGQDRG